MTHLQAILAMFEVVLMAVLASLLRFLWWWRGRWKAYNPGRGLAMRQQKSLMRMQMNDEESLMRVARQLMSRDPRWRVLWKTRAFRFMRSWPFVALDYVVYLGQ